MRPLCTIASGGALVAVSPPPRKLTSARLSANMEIEELCGIALVLVMMTRMHALRRNGERRRRRVPRWWMRPWIRDRLLEEQLNTAYKLQRQLAFVSIIKFVLVTIKKHFKKVSKISKIFLCIRVELYWMVVSVLKTVNQ